MNLFLSNVCLRFSLLIVLFVAAGVGPIGAEGTHLFVLSGQSNMNGLNPQDTLIPILEKRFGADHVIVVKDSHGGQPIRRWDKGWKLDDNRQAGPIGDLYDQLMSKVDAAIIDVEIRTVTFMWMQGERDAREQNADVYAESFHRLLDQLRVDLNHQDINYIIGRLSDFGVKHSEYPDWNKMRRVLVGLADVSNRSRWVNTDDLNDGKNRRGDEIKDDLHYSVEGYKRFGERMANAAIAVLEKNDIPYDLVPPATDHYYRVRYQASSRPGALPFPVQYTVWIPPHIQSLRGQALRGQSLRGQSLRGLIVHQHGCGTGSCRSGLTGAFDLHWQALAAKHDCALLAASYEQPADADCALWCDPRNGSDEAFQRSLADLAAASGHPELATVPWALWGHSGGGVWAGTMLLLHPQRVAAAWLRSGSPHLRPLPDRPSVKTISLPDQPLDSPVMLNLGAKEGFLVTEGRFASVWPRMKDVFLKLRQQGTPVGVAIDPRTGHECGNQRYLAMPWFDACLSARLPKQPNAPMRKMQSGSHWLAPLMREPQTATVASSADAYSGDPTSAIWLPNETVANAWMQFVQGNEVSDGTPPPSPTDLAFTGGRLTWKSHADLQSGIAYFVIRRDGKPIAKVPSVPSNAFGRPLAQGLQYSDTPAMPLTDLAFGDATIDAKQHHQYTVTTVNTVGLKSEPSQVLTRESTE